MIKVRYKKREAQNDYSIYLDIYIPRNKRTGEPKQRYYEFLNLYVSKDYSKFERSIAKDRLNLELAQNIASKRQNEINSGVFVQGVYKDISLFDFFEKNTDMTNKRNIYALRELKEFCEYAKIKKPTVKTFTKENCIDYFEFISKKVRNMNTNLQYFITLKICFNRAIEQNLIENNPTKAVKTPKNVEKPMSFLEHKELVLLKNCTFGDDKPKNELRKKAFFFSCYTSLRISDVLRLKWSDISENQISYIPYKTRKAKPFYNRVPVTDSTQQILDSLPKNDRFVFSGMKNCNVFLKQWAEAAGVTKNIHFHTSRHSFGTLSAQNNVSLISMNKVFFHSNMKTTMKYIDVTNEFMASELAKLPAL